MYIWHVIKRETQTNFYLCESRLLNILGIKGGTLRACHNICKLCRKMIPFASFQLTVKETRLRNYTSYGLLIKEADTSLEQDYFLPGYVYVGKEDGFKIILIIILKSQIGYKQLLKVITLHSDLICLCY